MMGIGGMMGMGGGQMPDFSKIRERMFERADANGDKGLSLEEFQNVGQNMPGGANRTAEQAAEAFGRIDTDKDGSINQEEMRAFGDRMSDQMRSMMVQMQAMMAGGQGQGQGGTREEAMRAMQAYGGGQGQSTDLTQSLLQALDRADSAKKERTDRQA